MFEALRVRNFRLLWFGSVFCYGGHWVQQATLGWVAYELTRSGSMVGLILGVRALPILLFAPVAGAIADRRNRRDILMATQVLYACTTVGIGIALAAGALRAWQLFAFVLITGVAFVFDRTTRQTLIPDLVPRDKVANAVALGNIVFSLMRVVSPAIAGYLLLWVGGAGNFFTQTGLYVLGVLTLLMIDRRIHVHKEARSSMWRSIAEGFRYAAHDRTTRIVVFFTALPFLLLTPTWSTLLPVFARDVFKTGPQALGWMLTCAGAGGLTGGLLSASLARLDRVGWLQIASHALFCASLIGVASAPSIWTALPCIFLAGIAEIVNSTAGQTILQLSTPNALRGRVMSLYQLNSALISIGSVVAGAGADWLGTRGITALNGTLGLLIGAATVLLSSHLRNLRLSHYTQQVAAPS